MQFTRIARNLQNDIYIFQTQYFVENQEKIINKIRSLTNDTYWRPKTFITLDLRSRFFHVVKSSQKYTAFITPDGLYDFKKKLFSFLQIVRQVLTGFCEIRDVLRDLPKEVTILLYMDDITCTINGIQIDWSKV